MYELLKDYLQETSGFHSEICIDNIIDKGIKFKVKYHIYESEYEKEVSIQDLMSFMYSELISVKRKFNF